MKVILKVILIILLGIGSLAIYAPKPDNSVSGSIDKFRTSYFSDFRQFEQEAIVLSEKADQTISEQQIADLQDQLIRTRLSYKRIEFIFDYYESVYNYMNVNGGPLPKVDKENALTDIVEPNGLQTLDEQIFSSQSYTEINTIRKLAKNLVEAIHNIELSHASINIGEKQLIEAIRTGLIRVFTLGVTGFDTPGSVNGLEEAAMSMQAMHEAFQVFEKEHTSNAKKAYRKSIKLFEKSINFLEKSNDFDTFDRMTFLKKYINPLYASLLDFQLQNGISTERFRYHAHNYLSRNLFDENFLNSNYYSEFTYLPLDNPASITLGQALFFDPILSKNKKMACSSCHDPQKAFTDGLPKSETTRPGHYTKRNSPTLINAAYSSRFFWDLREFNLERQVAHVVSDSLEFNISFREIANRLRQNQSYQDLFEMAYANISKENINSRSISNAIAAYVHSLSSFNSSFDKYVRNQQKSYPEEAIKGFNLFMGKAACGTCHFAPVFNGLVPPFYIETESEVLGVTNGFDTINPILDKDLGRLSNGLFNEKYPHFANSFKTVTIRNSELTAPYMHNGSFKTLEEVMEFYDKGGGAGMGLEVEHQTLAPDPIGLTKEEKDFIIEFLKTLTDTTRAIIK